MNNHMVNGEYTTRICVTMPRDFLEKLREFSRETGLPLSKLAREGILHQYEVWKRRMEVKA